MKSTSQNLEARARRAYEWGRLKFGLRRAIGVVPVVAMSTACCGSVTPSVLLGSMLAAAVIYLGWQGRFAAALGPGLFAGTAGFGLVLLAARFLPEIFAAYSAVICGASGVVAGLLITVLVAMKPERSRALMMGSGLVALGAATVGCAPLGLAGLVGVGLGAIASVGVGTLVLRPA